MSIGPIYDAIKCQLCGNIIRIFGNVMWCDECMDEFFASGMSIDEFVKMKKSGANS